MYKYGVTEQSTKFNSNVIAFQDEPTPEILWSSGNSMMSDQTDFLSPGFEFLTIKLKDQHSKVMNTFTC